MLTLANKHRGDLLGGLTAAVVALPLALAFGVASGAGALAGLYGAILVGFFASLFGGTPSQISGPTGPMTVVMALVVAHFSGHLGEAFLVVVLAGALQIGFGVAGLGRYIKLVPQPVVSGFMSGIGVIIIILQFAPALGFPSPAGSVLEKLVALPKQLAGPHLQDSLLCLLSLALVFATPKTVTRYIPAPLLAIVLGTLAGVTLAPAAAIIGEIPSGLPQLQMPDIQVAEIPFILRFALVLAFLGSIDSLLTSLVADSITRTHHNSNKELIGQGIGNMSSGLLGGIPGAGATIRTLVNVKAGGTTPISGMFHAAILLLVMLAFSDLASHIPLAVLAGILFKVGVDIIDWRFLRRIKTAPRGGVIIMLVTLFTTVFVDLMTAVAVGIVMASLLFVTRMADAQMESARIAFSGEHVPDLTDEEKAILDAAGGRIVLFHVEGPLSFGSARDIARLLHSSKEKDALVIDLTDVPFIDTSASISLEEVITQSREEGDVTFLFGARKRVLETLEKTGVLQELGKDQIVSSRLEALRRAAAAIESNSEPVTQP